MKPGTLAALATLSALLARPAAACEPPREEAVDAAKGLHRAAEVHFRAERYERAIDAWRLAYELDCRAHRLLINIGNAQLRAGDLEAAAATYRAYLSQDDDEETAAAVAAQLAAIEPRQPTGPTSPARPPASEEDETVVAPYLVAAVAAAAGTAGLVMVGVGVAGERRAEDRCPELVGCPRRTLEDRHRGVTLQQVGGGLAAVGWTTAAGALLYHLMIDDPGPVVPAVGLGGASVTVRF